MDTPPPHPRTTSHAAASTRPQAACARPLLPAGGTRLHGSRLVSLPPRILVVASSSSASPPPSRSFDDDDQLDTEPSRELWRVDPSASSKAKARLDLMWSVGSKKNRAPATCDCCGGAGSQPCTWCRGTGAMMVGGEVFCSLEGGCKGCPVCKSEGNVPCQACKGTGSRAAWLGPGCPVD